MFPLQNKGSPLLDARLDPEPGKKKCLKQHKLQMSNYYTDKTQHIPELGNYPTDTTQSMVRVKWNAVQNNSNSLGVGDGDKGKTEW